MKKALAVILAAAMVPAFAPAAQSQNQSQNQSLDDLFTQVSPSVVVVRAKGRDVNAGGGSPASTRPAQVS
jgi:hypothetical protein